MTADLVITGATGFLGWHVRVLARALGRPDPVLIGPRELADPGRLAEALDGADRVLHLAGINRGEPAQLARGNLELAEALAAGLRKCGTPPKSVVYANSIHAGNGTPYGDGKSAAAASLEEATRWSGSTFHDVRLPNLFGEQARRQSDSVVSTFCRVLAGGGTPRVDQDRLLDLLHATDAASLLLGSGSRTLPVRRTVRQVAAQLSRFAKRYRTGAIPELTDRFAVRLFNTYRSHCFPADTPLALTRHPDRQGDRIRAIDLHGGGGQTSVFGTHPGATRGEHYQLATVERLVVLRGEAEIRLRRMLHDDVLTFRVSGSEPAAVDMPTMWTHSITNIGTDELLTLVWSHDLSEPARHDTHAEPVPA